MSGGCRDMQKSSEAGHRCWRTKAIASEKVGQVFYTTPPFEPGLSPWLPADGLPGDNPGVDG